MSGLDSKLIAADGSRPTKMDVVRSFESRRRDPATMSVDTGLGAARIYLADRWSAAAGSGWITIQTMTGRSYTFK
jgi:hypothetical protein